MDENENKSKTLPIVLGLIACLIIGGLAGYYGNTGVCDDPIVCDDSIVCDECEICEECETLEEQEKQQTILTGYLIDGLFLNSYFSDEISDREISLFDDEVRFDGDEYDAEEIFYLNSIKLDANAKDFDGNAYLTFPVDSLKYEFVFESSLDTNLIDDNKLLKFSLLGQDVIVSEWDNDEITLITGIEYILEEGETITVNEAEITLQYVLEDYAYISVDDVEKAVYVGTTRTFADSDIEVRVDETFDYGLREDKVSRAVLIIGEDIEKVIEDEEEYAEDSIWEWVISDNSIGLVLVESFVEFEEDFNALQPEDTICLPNEYVCIRYNGLIGQDTEEYRFDIKGDFVRVKGNLLSGTDEYTEVYVEKSTGLVYDDDDKEYQIVGLITLGDTESTLEITTDGIVVNDFEVNFDLNDTNIVIDDVDYLTDYGILVENTEDSIEDQEFTIVVPEEKSEGVITVKSSGFTVPVEETEE